MWRAGTETPSTSFFQYHTDQHRRLYWG